MSTMKKVPEADVMTDNKSGVAPESKIEKTRSKSGHERRVNTAVYVVLIVMSVVWLTPFVFLVCQSFRSFLNEGGGMVPYVIPQKGFSLDNYKALFIKGFTAKKYLVNDLTLQEFFDTLDGDETLARDNAEAAALLRSAAEGRDPAKDTISSVMSAVQKDESVGQDKRDAASAFMRTVFSAARNQRFENDFRQDFNGRFIPWWTKTFVIGACFSLAVVALCILLKRLNENSDQLYRFRLLIMLGILIAAYLCYVLTIKQQMGYAPAAAGDYVQLGIIFLLFALFSLLAVNSFLKREGKLLQQIPGYPPETAWDKIKKAPVLFLEFLAMFVVMTCALIPTENSDYVGWYGNTLTIALFTAVIQTVIVLSVSYALSRLRFKGRKLIMNVVLVLGLFPGFLSMITLYFLLKSLGMTGPGAVPGLILIYCASSGMGYYISKGFFDTIPKSLDESARIDGATRFQVFLKIIMPLAKPIVIYTVLMAFMGPWGDYVFASYVAFGNVPTYNVAVGLYQWVNVADYQGYFTLFCAGGVLVAVPITALFLALQKYYVEGVTGGAVKG